MTMIHSVHAMVPGATRLPAAQKPPRFGAVFSTPVSDEVFIQAFNTSCIHTNASSCYRFRTITNTLKRRWEEHTHKQEELGQKADDAGRYALTRWFAQRALKQLGPFDDKIPLSVIFPEADSPAQMQEKVKQDLQLVKDKEMIEFVYDRSDPKRVQAVYLTDKAKKLVGLSAVPHRP